MEIIKQQMIAMIAMFALGWCGAMIFDFFGAIRWQYKIKNLGVMIGDFLCCTTFGCFFIWTLLLTNKGQMRNYILIGLMLGVFGYIKVGHKWSYPPMVKSIGLIDRLVRWVCRTIYYPFYVIKKYFLQPAKKKYKMVSIKAKLQRDTKK